MRLACVEVRVEVGQKWLGIGAGLEKDLRGYLSNREHDWRVTVLILAVDVDAERNELLQAHWRVAASVVKMRGRGRRGRRQG